MKGFHKIFLRAESGPEKPIDISPPFVYDDSISNISDDLRYSFGESAVLHRGWKTTEKGKRQGRFLHACRDGPLYLSDMMRFEKEDAFRGLFRDYPLILIRADEPMDYGAFRTSLRELLAVLPLRKDRREMRKFIGEREAYRKLDRETLEAIAVMTDNRRLLEKAEDHRNEKGEYDMYEEMGSFFMDGVEEGMEKGREEGRAEGIEEGREEGIRAMILDNLENGSSGEQIREKLGKYFGMSEKRASEYLEHFLQEKGYLSAI